MIPRTISEQERSIISALLQRRPDTLHHVRALDNLLVAEMDDGKMGSLALIPKGIENVNRSFGKQILLGEFVDADGISVSIAVNVDGQGELYELDVWKVNFAPLLSWPDPAKIKIV